MLKRPYLFLDFRACICARFVNKPGKVFSFGPSPEVCTVEIPFPSVLVLRTSHCELLENAEEMRDAYIL
jgi:hypothetical protein